MLFLGMDDLMAQDNVRFQIVAPVGAMFAVGTGESSRTTIVVGLDMGGKVGAPRERMGAEGTEERVRVLTMSEEMDLEHGLEDGCE